METVEVKYFIETARLGSIRKAAETIGISPSAISKAIGRLESELETKLIEKVGRNLVLTSAGQKLERQGAEFLAMERQIKSSHRPLSVAGSLRVVGPELPLSYWGVSLQKKIAKLNPRINIEYEVVSNTDVLDRVNSYKADLALFACDKKMKTDNSLMKKLAEVTFQPFVAKSHPLAKKRRVIGADLLNEHFVVTNSSALNLLPFPESGDGWSANKLNRQNITFTDSLKLVDSMVLEGMAISYLPNFYGKSLGLKALNVEGIPDSKKVTVFLRRNKYGLNDLWAKI